MYTHREILAVVLVAALGVALLLKPATVIRLQFFAHGPTTGRRGPYGEAQEFSAEKLWLARGVGLAALALGAVILALPHV